MYAIEVVIILKQIAVTLRMEKDIPCKWYPKENRGGHTYIRQIDFRSNTVTRGKEGHYIMVKGPIDLEGKVRSQYLLYSKI